MWWTTRESRVELPPLQGLITKAVTISVVEKREISLTNPALVLIMA